MAEGKANVLLVAGQGVVDTFIRPETMEKLESMVNLTFRPGLPKEDAAYSQALREAEAEIVITGWGGPVLTTKVAEENPQLKYLCNLTGSVSPMVEREVVAGGLLVTHWGTLIGPSVAEASLLGILCCLRRTTEVTLRTHVERGWRGGEKEVETLFYKTVGLHGFGIIAQNLVKLLEPFQCKISTYSPHAPDEALAQYNVERVADLKTLYASNKIVSCHASKTPENYHVVNAEILGAMQDGAVFVNTGRGAVVDEQALIEELRRGRIRASLDVYEQEPPPPDSPLRGLANCHMTCHTGGPTPDWMPIIGDAAIENIRCYLNGEPLDNTVDAAKYDLIT